MKIGAITVGQAPRVDVTADIMDILGPKVELLERGGLDGLSREEIEQFKPEPGDYILVSRLVDGSSVTFAEKYILGRLQKAIDALEAEGVTLIMVFCTGEFPAELRSNVPMIFPGDVIERIAPMLTNRSSIIAVTPSPLQIEQSQAKWLKYVDKCVSVSVSPYGSYEDVAALAAEIKDVDADLIVLDCIGFTQQMKEMFAEKTGKPILLPRTLLARIVAEIADV
jgi:protein AroM